jgi:hypothetical protein
MSASDCPYCERRPRRLNEPTCGLPHCIDQHVSVQADRAEASEGDNVIFSRGYRCDSCGHEQEADVACEACGSHGVVPFGFAEKRETCEHGWDKGLVDQDGTPLCDQCPKPAPPDAVADTARLYDTAVSPGEEERLREARQPRPDCKHCRLIGELCGLCERLEMGELPEPSPTARAIAASTGLDPHTVSLVFDLERVLRRHGLARQQYALASALWRSVCQHPCLRMTEDFLVGRLTLTDGGRRVSFEADVFPPRPVESVREAIAQSRSKEKERE